MRIKPARRINGSVRLPGDKSISHRAAMIAALANGNSIITNFSDSQDCNSTLFCLAKLGVKIGRDGSDVQIQGCENKRLSAPVMTLDCGNSGSTMRMLAGVLAGQEFESTLTGDSSLEARPMQRIIEPLEKMGAVVGSNEGRPPLHVQGRAKLTAITHELPIASAQIKSSVLLAGLYASGRTEVVDLRGIITRDHTERMLEWFGVPVETGKRNGQAASWAVCGPVTFNARDVQIPGDFSSAASLIAAAALLPGSELKIENVGLNPTRTRFIEILSSMGATIEVEDARVDCNEPRGTLLTLGTSKPRTRKVVSGPMVAALMDELPLLAVVGTQVEGGIVIREAGELRTKESDRIAATVKNLRAMGAEVEEYDYGLTVEGPVTLQGAAIDSFGDHRIAMAFTVAALIAEGDSEITDSDCVGVSFPGFFEVVESIVER